MTQKIILIMKNHDRIICQLKIFSKSLKRVQYF